MHSITRTYSGKGSKEFLDLLETRKSEVSDMMKKVTGFVSYTLSRNGEGGSSVTVCKDKVGADESARLAKEWTAKNAGTLGLSPPVVSEGAVIITAKKDEGAFGGPLDHYRGAPTALMSPC